MIPVTLEGWTLAAIEQLLSHQVFEGATFDFKNGLPHAKGEPAKQRLRQAISSFANSRGGFLIFGIADDRRLPTAQRLQGVDPALDFMANFQSYVAQCTPTIEWKPRVPSLSLASNKLIHVIEVLEGKQKPYGFLDGGRWALLKRTEGGSTESLSYQEMRDSFREHRAILAALQRMKIELTRIKDHAQELNMALSRGALTKDLLTPFQVSRLEMASMQAFGNIPTNSDLELRIGRILSEGVVADTTMAALRARGGPVRALGNMPERIYHDSALALQQLENVIKLHFNS